jgi:small-conductance mechanosensitive channel
MAENAKKHLEGTNWLGLLSFGLFLILLGTIWMATPNLTEDIRAFVDPKNWHLENVTENMAFPEPKDSHPILYTATMQFCFIFGALQIAILVLRFAFHDSINKKAETVSGIAFWFSISFFLHMLINGLAFFGFFGGIIISGGLALLTGSVVKLFR